MGKTFTFELHPNRTLHLILYKNVKNAKDLRALLLQGKEEVGFINAELILDEFQVLVAANKAIHYQKLGQMITKNIHAELVYNLSPNTNISSSLKQFGIGDSTHILLVALFDASEDKIAHIKSLVQGEEVELNEQSQLPFGSTFHAQHAKKAYQLTNEEVNSPHTLLPTLVNLIAIKDA
mmetsp:Transcript_21609/g.30203  ORF Transcript_21609/g.30203 Transcript_21609/m.30203 type:complete len:179 (+) Transcript_21609:48-584(+)